MSKAKVMNRMETKLKSKINVVLSVFFAFFLSTNIYAQKSLKYDLSSPYGTVVTHLKFLQESNYKPGVSVKAFSVVDGMSLSERKAIAIKLKQIYDGTEYIDIEKIPKEPNYTDSTNNRLSEYTILKEYPEVYVTKIGDKWLYSKETVKAIPAIHHKLYPFGMDKILEYTSNQKLGFLAKTFLGLKIWQYIAMILVALLSLIIHKLLTVFFNRVISKLLVKLGYKKIASSIILPVARPFSVFVILFLIKEIYPVFQLPIQFGQYILWVLKAIVPFFLVVVIYRIVDIISYYLKNIAAKTENTLDDQLVPLVKKSLKIVVIIGGCLFILENLNFDITGLLAGISIGGLAFALAAQDTIKNLFGSLTIFIDKPFQVGDWVVADGVDGTVEEVGFRSTRIRTFHNSLLSIPNGKIADMTVDNMGLRVYRRFSTTIGITYDTPADVIEVFVEGLREMVRNHPKTRKDFFEIHLNSFGNSSLNILFYIFFEVPDWSKELSTRQDIMINIIRLAEKIGVRFAFPTSTLHIEEMPGQPSLTPKFELSKEELMKKIKREK